MTDQRAQRLRLGGELAHALGPYGPVTAGEGASARGAGVGCEGALGGIRIASGVCDAGLRRGDHVARCVLPERTGACSPTWRGDGGRTSMTRELDFI